jgi:uncharacterized coiled-coil protein SlyX
VIDPEELYARYLAGRLKTRGDVEALETRISDLEAKLATARDALKDIAETNGGGPVDRNNRMKRTARTAIALIEKETK